MSDLRRDEVKYIRDLAKKSYKKGNECYICLTTENLQFHHFYSISLLWNKWKIQNDVKIDTLEDIIKYREVFKEVHHRELYEETITLCKFHHMDRLHKVYGRTPALSTAEKQKRWCEIQKSKNNNN